MQHAFQKEIKTLLKHAAFSLCTSKYTNMSTQVNTTQEIADRLVELCRKVDYRAAQSELYASNVASVEPEGSPWESVEGIEQVNGKIDKWYDMVEEIHEILVSDPLVAGNFFSCKMTFDVTFKGMGRNRGEEIAVFKVEGGKIVLEHFFYQM